MGLIQQSSSFVHSLQGVEGATGTFLDKARAFASEAKQACLPSPFKCPTPTFFSFRFLLFALKVIHSVSAMLVVFVSHLWQCSSLLYRVGVKENFRHVTLLQIDLNQPRAPRTSQNATLISCDLNTKLNSCSSRVINSSREAGPECMTNDSLVFLVYLILVSESAMPFNAFHSSLCKSWIWAAPQSCRFPKLLLFRSLEQNVVLRPSATTRRCQGFQGMCSSLVCSGIGGQANVKE